MPHPRKSFLLAKSPVQIGLMVFKFGDSYKLTFDMFFFFEIDIWHVLFQITPKKHKIDVI